MKRVVHFMPANGFPSAVYNPIMKGMETKLQQLWPQTNVTVRGSDVYDVLRSPDATCEDMAKDCIRNIEQYSDEPVIGIGHSLGGVVIATAAVMRPELFRGAIMVDSPMVFTNVERFLFNLTPASLFDKVHPLIPSTLRRVNTWKNRYDAANYMKSKALYANMDPEIFNSFLYHALKPQSDVSGTAEHTDARDIPLELVWPREAEVTAYRNVTRIANSDFTPYLLKNVMKEQVPSYFLYSSQHYFLKKRQLDWSQNHYKHTEFVPFDEGHFWPLEKPDNFADFLSKFIAEKLPLDQKV